MVAPQGRTRIEHIAQRFGDKFEWITVGRTAFLPIQFQARHVRYHFQEGENLSEMLSGLTPCFVLLPSIWPETFSYALHDALACGYPILTLRESGNIAAVVQEEGAGRVFDTEGELLDFLAQPAADLETDYARWAHSFEVLPNSDAIAEIYLGSAPPPRWSALEMTLQT